MVPHIVPHVSDDNMLFASKWVVRKRVGILAFLLQNFDDTSSCSILPYEDFVFFGDDWKESLISFLSYTFPVMTSESKIYIHWLDEIAFNDKNKLFYYRFSEQVVTNLKNLKKKYPNDYSQLLLFNRANSFNIYRFLVDEIQKHNYENSFSITCDKLRTICNMYNGTYTSTSEFKRIVLKNAMQDITTYLNKEVSFSSVDSNLTFYFDRKDFCNT